MGLGAAITANQGVAAAQPGDSTSPGNVHAESGNPVSTNGSPRRAASARTRTAGTASVSSARTGAVGDSRRAGPTSARGPRPPAAAEATDEPSAVADVQRPSGPALRPRSTGQSARLTALPVTGEQVAAPALVAARPVTLKSIVTDVLTWAGLGPLASGVQIPATPVPTVVESLWLFVRRTQYVVNNQRPTATVALSEQGPYGAVDGVLTVTDYEGDVPTFKLGQLPKYGTVTIGADGHFTYVPDDSWAASGVADQFTISVDDRIGNPAHIYGLLGLLGIVRPYSVKISVNVTPFTAHPDADGVIDRAELEDLAQLSGLEVSENNDRTVREIDGTFTNDIVRTADDAARVVNYVAGILGAADGFANPADITTQILGTGTTFYRLTQSVNDLPVVGGEVVLVADGSGGVRSLFSYYDSDLAAVDVTPDESIDEESEANAVVAGAVLDNLATADQATRDAVAASLKYRSGLVVYDLNADATPVLAWRVDVYTAPEDGTVDVPSINDTYYLAANGADPSRVLLAFSQDVDASTAASTPSIGAYVSSTPNRLPGTSVGSNYNGSTAAVTTNLRKVYTYYDQLGQTSFDDRNAAIRVTLLPNSFNNAQWKFDLKQFVFAEKYTSSLDVAGHEFTHAVIDYNIVSGSERGLIYYGESGALNESYADIMGNLIEGKSNAGRWLIAEDSGAIRDMSNPASFGQPDDYDNRATGSADYGGVHKNSGIFNYAAYRMMNDSRTASVSKAKWAEVFYDSMFRLSVNSNFVDGRAAVISSAKQLGFTAEQQQAVKDAFDSAGITERQTVRVVLRWGATPSDLDSHLVGPGVNGGRFHVWYASRDYYADGSTDSPTALLAADLDYDDTSSYGPESTTIRILTPGMYYFYVHDFSNGSSTDSTALATSSAVVQYYGPRNSTTPYVLRANGTSEGTYWLVMKVAIAGTGASKSVVMTPINSYGYSEPTNGVFA